MKVFFFLFFSIAASAVEQSPVVTQTKHYWGMQGGVRTSSARTSGSMPAAQYWNPQPVLGIQYGRTLKEFVSTRSLFLDLGLRYGRRGYAYSQKILNEDVNFQLRQDSILLSALGVFRLLPTARLQVVPRVLIGFEPAYLVKTERDRKSRFVNTTTNETSEHAKIDLSAVVGAGLERAILAENFVFIQVLLTYGLLNVSKHPHENVKNVGAELIGGLSFWL